MSGTGRPDGAVDEASEAALYRTAIALPQQDPSNPSPLLGEFSVPLRWKSSTALARPDLPPQREADQEATSALVWTPPAEASHDAWHDESRPARPASPWSPPPPAVTSDASGLGEGPARYDGEPTQALPRMAEHAPRERPAAGERSGRRRRRTLAIALPLLLVGAVAAFLAGRHAPSPPAPRADGALAGPSGSGTASGAASAPADPVPALPGAGAPGAPTPSRAASHSASATPPPTTASAPGRPPTTGGSSPGMSRAAAGPAAPASPSPPRQSAGAAVKAVGATASRAAAAASSGAPGYPVVGPGASGSSVTEVQNLLKQHGYYLLGASDGQYGTATQASVRRFQADQSLPATGVVDQATWNALLQSP